MPTVPAVMRLTHITAFVRQGLLAKTVKVPQMYAKYELFIENNFLLIGPYRIVFLERFCSSVVTCETVVISHKILSMVLLIV